MLLALLSYYFLLAMAYRIVLVSQTLWTTGYCWSCYQSNNHDHGDDDGDDGDDGDGDEH